MPCVSSAHSATSTTATASADARHSPVPASRLYPVAVIQRSLSGLPLEGNLVTYERIRDQNRREALDRLSAKVDEAGRRGIEPTDLLLRLGKTLPNFASLLNDELNLG
jgi:hypothetical protein